jgi:quinol-cytochrome oxidoreductase complex cytochrome b subunit
MNVSKILVTIIAIAIFIVLFAVVVGVRGDNGNSTPGIIGLILFAGLFFALKAVWKKNDKDNHDIQKKE